MNVYTYMRTTARAPLHGSRVEGVTLKVQGLGFGGGVGGVWGIDSGP